MALLLQSAFVSLHPGLSKASNIINFACTKLYSVAYMEFLVDQIIGKGSDAIKALGTKTAFTQTSLFKKGRL